MTNRKLGGWLLVALAVVGVAVAVAAVSAHGTERTQKPEMAPETMPADSDAVGGAARMATSMTDHVGPGAIEDMGSHIGVTGDELPQHRTGGTHNAGGTPRQAHGC